MPAESDRHAAAAALTLAGVRVLRGLPEEERRYLETRCTFRRVDPGEVLLARYNTGMAVYFIIEGRARVVHYLDGQDEITIATVAAGEALGEISAIDGGTASATIVAEDECVIAELPKEDFQALLVRRSAMPRLASSAIAAATASRVVCARIARS